MHDGDALAIGSFRFVVEIKGSKPVNLDKPEDMIQSIADVLLPPILEFGEQQRKAS